VIDYLDSDDLEMSMVIDAPVRGVNGKPLTMQEKIANKEKDI
jgi:hypothetical protein